MIKKIVLLLVILALASCSSSKPAIATTKKAAAVQSRTAATKRSTPVKPIGKDYPLQIIQLRLFNQLQKQLLPVI